MEHNSATIMSCEVRGEAVPADNLVSIPGLGLIKPDTSESEPYESKAEASNGSGLLDALMQHVDAQSNAQGSEMQQTAQETLCVQTVQETPRMQKSSLETSEAAPFHDDNAATAAASVPAGRCFPEEGRDSSDSRQITAGNVGDTEHERSAPDSAVEDGTDESTQQVVETLEGKVGDVTAINIAGVGLVKAEDADSTDTTFEKQDRSSALPPPALQPPQSTPFDNPTSIHDDSREEFAVMEEESVNYDKGLEQNDEIQDETTLGNPASENVASAGSSNEVDVIDEGGGVVEKAKVDDAPNKDAAQNHSTPMTDEKISPSSAIKEGSGSSQTGPSGSNDATVKAEIDLTQAKENGAAQPADVEMLEHELEQQGKPHLSTPMEADPTVASLREQLPPVNNVEEPENTQGGQDAEWEVDSSPIDSPAHSDTTSDTTSTDESDEDDPDVDGDYAMLDPEEQARILMQGDGGSDDEGNPKSGAKGGTAQLRTANEKAEEVVPKPDIQVTEDMKIEELGSVEGIVENAVLVKAKVSGEYRVLESNSLLCLQDRSVVGVVSETLGRVQQPLYTIRFTNEDAIKEAGLDLKNTPVYYVEQHSTFVFTQSLRAVKGSDASNFHDEEVAAEEMEFSDDEAEAEHKRRLKLKKQGRKDDRNDRFAPARGNRGASMIGSVQTNSDINGETTAEMNYDDIPPMGDDGYTPLARPTNLHEMMGPGEGPLEGRQPVSSSSDRGHDRGRGRGRGRGDRGRGDRGTRGGRGGRGRGGWDRSSNNQRGSFSSGQQTSPVPKSESSSSPRTSTYGHQQQQQRLQQSQTPTFALPPIPPPSQYPYPQMPPQPQHPSFSYPKPTPLQAPTISPQPSSYPTFSPSPISPLPQTSFSYNNYAHQHNQQYSPTQSSNRHRPPPNQQQSYEDNHQQWQNQFNGGQQGQGQPQMPPPGSHVNPAFFEALRQQRGGGNWQGGSR